MAGASCWLPRCSSPITTDGASSLRTTCPRSLKTWPTSHPTAAPSRQFSSSNSAGAAQGKARAGACVPWKETTVHLGDHAFRDQDVLDALKTPEPQAKYLELMDKCP